MSTEIDKSKILNDLKAHYGFKSDTDFALFLGIKPQTLSSWHQRNTFDIALLYAKCVNIDGNFLLTGTGSIEKRKVNETLPNESGTKSVTFTDESKNAKNVTNFYQRMPSVVTVDSAGKDNIVLVPASAQAGYLAGYDNPEWIQRLPAYNLPMLNNGTFRMFQIKGHSMFPTMHDKAYVATEWVENWLNIKDNNIYVVVVQGEDYEGIVIKRTLNRLKKYKNLFLKSDNRKEHPNITVQMHDIKEIWEVKLYLGWDLPDPALLYDRVSDLEAEMEQLKSNLKAKIKA